VCISRLWRSFTVALGWAEGGCHCARRLQGAGEKQGTGSPFEPAAQRDRLPCKTIAGAHRQAQVRSRTAMIFFQHLDISYQRNQTGIADVEQPMRHPAGRRIRLGGIEGRLGAVGIIEQTHQALHGVTQRCEITHHRHVVVHMDRLARQHQSTLPNIDRILAETMPLPTSSARSIGRLGHVARAGAASRAKRGGMECSGQVAVFAQKGDQGDHEAGEHRIQPWRSRQQGHQPGRRCAPERGAAPAGKTSQQCAGNALRAHHI